MNVASHGSSAFNVNIGGGGVFDDTGNWFAGVIDEVAIYSVALEQDNIKAIMNDGFALIHSVSAAGKLAASWGNLKVEY